MDALLLLGGLAALILFDVLALLWGADSRDRPVREPGDRPIT